MSKGYLSLILHAHLPFVRHPESEEFLEERWLFEALSETYIPLIMSFDRLIHDNVPFRITISLSPTLINMLNDPLLQNRYRQHLEKTIELTDKELKRTESQPEYHQVVNMYHRLYRDIYHNYINVYHQNLIKAFKKFQDLGLVEVITCGASHGFFPLNNLYKQGINAQVGIAVDTYKDSFGFIPKGFWLPECAYAPGDDTILKDFGIKYFITESHGVLFADKMPRYGVFAPIETPSGVSVFGRDLESSKQVWSAQEGYPGDFDYREYYRDIGYDLDEEYIGPYIHPKGLRVNTGLKYFKVTGKTENKEIYNPQHGLEKAATHAGNFLFNRQKQIEHLAGIMDRKPMVVSPYDAELFGHWWFEGPKFLEFLFRKLHHDQDVVELKTPGDYLTEYPINQVTVPTMSTWGHKGYNEFWLDDSNNWIYPHLHKATERMVELANNNLQAEGVMQRALNQAARELILAQSSDWAFIMKTGTMVEYAEKRTKDHIGRFNRLYEAIKSDSINESWLSELEAFNNVFPNINYQLYAG